MNLRSSVLSLAFLVILSFPALAHPHHHHPGQHGIHRVVVAVHPHAFVRLHRGFHRAVVVASAATELPHPAGCPATEFCACGAAVEVFGRPIRELWLAANWFRFPPAALAPGMAAVRQHHVMVIKQVVGPNRAVVYDANSGHHRTQVHEVSLQGYSIRNPRGG